MPPLARTLAALLLAPLLGFPTCGERGPNREPNPVEDFVVTDEDTPISFNVLANDTDPDRDRLRIQSFGPDEILRDTFLTCREDGDCQLDTFPGRYGSVDHGYVACDRRFCVESFIHIVITDVPNPPEATDDASATDGVRRVRVAILANDAFNDGAPAPETLVISPLPTRGSALWNPVFDADSNRWDPDSLKLVYVPGPGFDAAGDSFGYRLCDTKSLCTNTATVTIALGPVANEPPRAETDYFSVAENMLGFFSLLANDSDPNGDSLAIEPFAGATLLGAWVACEATGECSYTPLEGTAGGDDFFCYVVCDVDAACAAAEVYVHVAPAVFPPAPEDDYATTDVVTPISIPVLANDTDPDGDAFALVEMLNETTGFDATLSCLDSACSYTPSSVRFRTGVDSFAYQVCDVHGLCAAATVYVTVQGIRVPPIAEPDELVTDRDVPGELAILANDVFEYSGVDASSVAIVAGPEHGAASFDVEAQSLVYSPAPGFTGSDALRYRVCNRDGLCDEGDVSILVRSPGGA